MKKQYSLDYTIISDKERMEAVREIIDTATKPFSATDLEQLASYVLYGKDESGKNAIQRGETDDRETRRYKLAKRMDEKVQSLDEILENPLASENELLDPFQRSRYFKKTRTVKRPKKDDPGDSWIPGMQELWAAIDRVEHTIKANEGKLPFNEDDTVITDPYRLWLLKHQMIDMRRHQYYLLESYKPTIRFLALTHPQSRTYTFDEDTFYWMRREEWDRKVAATYMPYISKNIEDYERRIDENGQEWIKWVVSRQAFDWENPEHVRCLFEHYSAIYMENYDKLDSWGRTLIYDFDRYVDRANFSPIFQYIILRRIDKATLSQIEQEIQMKFGIRIAPTTISTYCTKEIPQTIAQQATKDRLFLETPASERKTCNICKQNLPAHPLFFIRNPNKKMGFEACCKECQRMRRMVLAEERRLKNK